MKKLIIFILLLSLQCFADSFSNEYLTINVYKGWNTLEEKQYALEYQPHEVNYDFITEQEKYKNQKFDLTAFKEKFQDKYIPIVINLIQKKEFKEWYDSLYLDRIYTYNKSFILKDMRGWEYSDNQTPPMLGAYYYPNVPLENDYKIVFLLPIELSKEDISVSFATSDKFKKILKIKKEDNSSYLTRISVLKEEEKNIQKLIDKQ